MFRLRRKSPAKHSRRRLYILAFTLPLLVILIPIVYFSLKYATKTQAVWLDDAWTYRKRIPITAHTGAETNKYFAVTIDTSDTTKFQADCGDMRFTDINGKLLQYYIASGCGTSSTVTHVLVPDFLINATDYYLYYGNPSAPNGFSAADFTAGTGVTVGSIGSEEKGTGPVAYWSFDEATGTSAYDSTKSQTTGTLTNMASPPTGSSGWQQEDVCIVQKCLSFDGSDDYVTVPDANSLDITTSFTISAWINTRSLSGTDIAVVNKGRDATSTYAYEFGLDTGKFALKLYDGTNNPTVIGTTTATVQTWYYVVGTYDGSTLKIYVNGNLENSTSFSISIGNQTGPLVIGKNANASNRYFSGKADDVRIYAYPLTSTQIRSNYRSRGALDTAAITSGERDQSSLSSGLAAYWKMDEASANSCVGGSNDNCDSSGYGADAAWVGTATSGVGEFGNSLSLDGGGGADVGSSPTITGTGVTLAAWINPSSTSTRNEILDIKGFNLLNLQSAKVCFYDGDVNSAYFCSTASVTTNTWTHVLATYDPTSNTERIYINGVLDSSFTPSGVPSGGSLSTSLGYCNACGTYGFTGKLDEVRAYNRAFSAQEARQLYAFAPGPVGYWKLDEKTGTSAGDSSGNGNTGTLTNGPTWVTGKMGSAVSFDSVDDVIDAGSGTTLDDLPMISAEAWIYPKSLGEGGLARIFEKQATVTTLGWLLQLNTNNQLIFRVDYSGVDLQHATANNAITLNAWNHVVATWDGSSTAANVHIYVNGVETAYSTTTDGTLTRASDAAQNLRIGNTNDGSRTFDGYIDEAKIYNYIRTSSQVIEDMNGGHPLGGSPVGSQVAYWDMDEMNGTTAHDASINGNALTLSAASWTTSGKTNGAWNGTGSVWLTRADDDDFDFAASDNFSLSMWFKSDSTTNPTNNEYLYSKGTITNTGTAGYVVYADSAGKLNFGVKDDGAWGASSPNTITPDDVATSTTDLYDNTWHHIVAEKVGTTGIYLYVDGKLNASDTSIAATATLANSIAIRVGDDDADAANSFAGDLDEIKVYRDALTVDQVAIDYNSGSSVNYGSTATSESTQITGTAETPPVGYWNFDQHSGTSATDLSGNENTGTLTNGPTWSTGKYGGSVTLDGSNDYVSMGTAAAVSNPSAITISVWVKPSSIDHQVVSYFLAKDGAGTGAGSGWGMAINGTYTLGCSGTGLNLFYFYTAGTLACSTSEIPLNTWTHIEVTNASGSTKIYINGRLESTTSHTLQTDSANTLYVGRNTAGTLLYQGSIDDLKIYNYARTAAQVAYDYNRGAPIGWWQFDECQGAVAHDASGNAKHATLTYGGGTYTQVGTCTSGTSSDAWYGGATGRFNSSLAMDTTTDTINVGNVSLYGFDRTNSFTLSIWIKTSSNSNMTLLSKQDSSSPFSGWNMQTGGAGTLYFQLVNTYSSNALEVRNTNAITYSDGNWHMVTMTYNGSSLDAGVGIYFDGKQVSTTASFTSSLSSSITNSIPVYIGSRNGTAQKFSGQLDDARIYNYALSASQVQKLYNGGSAVNFGPSTGQP